MKDEIDADHSRCKSTLVADAGFNDFQSILDVTQIAAKPTGEVVVHNDFLTAPNKSRGEIGSDESCPACYENPGQCSGLSKSCNK